MAISARTLAAKCPTIRIGSGLSAVDSPANERTNHEGSAARARIPVLTDTENPTSAVSFSVAPAIRPSARQPECCKLGGWSEVERAASPNGLGPRLRGLVTSRIWERATICLHAIFFVLNTMRPPRAVSTTSMLSRRPRRALSTVVSSSKDAENVSSGVRATKSRRRFVSTSVPLSDGPKPSGPDWMQAGQLARTHSFI